MAGLSIGAILSPTNSPPFPLHIHTVYEFIYKCIPIVMGFALCLPAGKFVGRIGGLSPTVCFELSCRH